MSSRLSRVCHHLSLRRPGLKGRVAVPISHRRSYYAAKAQFTTLNEHGRPVSSDIDIRIGDPDEAYVYVDPGVGKAIKSLIVRQGGTEPETRRELKTLPLSFDHKSRHFFHRAVPFPLLEINQGLRRQTSTHISPATLWLSGNWHALTLNGSFDEFYERESRKSPDELRHTLEMLRET